MLAIAFPTISPNSKARPAFTIRRQQEEARGLIVQSTARAENDDDSPVELFDCVVEDAHRWPLIPDDTYRVRYTRHECGRVASFNQQAKLFFRARIIDPGPYNGIELFRSYRVTLIVGGKSTRFKVRRNSDLMKMVCKVLDVAKLPIESRSDPSSRWCSSLDPHREEGRQAATSCIRPSGTALSMRSSESKQEHRSHES